MAAMKIDISDVVNRAIEKIKQEGYTVQKWIPCSEMMPENNVPVLYFWKTENGTGAVLHGWHFEIEALGSAWHQSGVGMERPDNEVLYWMPLPEPPEVNSDAD